MMLTNSGAEWRQTHVETSAFYTNKEVDRLIKDTEQSVTSELEGGNRSKAMKRLRVPPLGDVQHPWTNFRTGLFMGMFIILVMAIVLSLIFMRPRDWEPALQMYRGMVIVIFDLFLLGINTYGWRSSGVNHVLIFEIDPRHHLSHAQLLELASMLGVAWAISVLAYIYSEFILVPPMVMPLSFAAFLVVALINPLKFFYYRARMWLLRILYRIFTAPFHHVSFADFWLADQLNSLATVLLDFEFLVCFYAFDVDWHGEERAPVCSKTYVGLAVRGVVSCLPAWFRFAQCLRRYKDTRLINPHIINAGKYSTTFLVVLCATLYKIHIKVSGDEERQASPAYYLLIIAAVGSSCYTYTWDIKMDWGLLDKSAGENRFLREEVVYAYKGYYYIAMVEDLILRFIWIISVTVGEMQVFNSHILKSIFCFLEVFRRFVWNFFRLENEHLNNCGQFRAVRDISIGPIDSSLEQQLLDIMDESDQGSDDWRLHDKRKRNRTPKEVQIFLDEEPLLNGGQKEL